MSHIEKNKLNKNFNSWAIFGLINNSQEHDLPVIAWKIVTGEKITAEVNFHIVRKTKSEIVIRGKNPHAKKTLGDLSVGAHNLNFYLPKDSALFQSEVKQILSNGDVLVRIPKMIAQVERRKHMRLFLEQGLELELAFSKENHGQRKIQQKFSKSCFDISAGGLSFILTRSETSFFKKNDLITPLEIHLPNKTIKVVAKVSDVLEIIPNEQNRLNYKGYKICIQFEKIRKDDLALIESYVFDHLELEEVI